MSHIAQNHRSSFFICPSSRPQILSNRAPLQNSRNPNERQQILNMIEKKTKSINKLNSALQQKTSQLQDLRKLLVHLNDEKQNETELLSQQIQELEQKLSGFKVALKAAYKYGDCAIYWTKYTD